MTVSETVADSFGEIVDSIELPALLHEMHIEPRCRICRNDYVRKKVNDMLAAGLSYAMIMRAIEEDNTKLDKRDRVTVDSIRNHTARHFPRAERGQGHLPADPRATGAGERRRLC